jgi:hypothetical protein
VDEHPAANGRVSFRELYAALSSLREELASGQHAQAADLLAAVAAIEHRLSARIERLEATVNLHDDLIQQLRGARNLLNMVFGVSLLTAVMGLSGGWLSSRLFEEARYCFAYGQYLAAAMLGVAFIERLFAARFFASGRDDLERAGGASLLREALDQSLITPQEFEVFDRVRSIRNPIAHFRRPLGADAVESRALKKDGEVDALAQEDARAVLAAVFAVLAKSAI